MYQYVRARFNRRTRSQGEAWVGVTWVRHIKILRTAVEREGRSTTPEDKKKKTDVIMSPWPTVDSSAMRHK